MIKAGIIGGDSLKAGELIRLLINHPDVDIAWIHNPAAPGCPVSDIHRGLIGETDIRFSPGFDLNSVDVVFSCLPQGQSTNLLDHNTLPPTLRFIDLSGDFLDTTSRSSFVYGLPELNRKAMVRGALHVAVPGSVAMALNLGLLPLAKNLMLNSPVHVSVVTPHSACVSCHDETSEVLRSLQSSFHSPIDIVACFNPRSRTTVITAATTSAVAIDQLTNLYNDYYDDHRFTYVVDSPATTSDIANTNKCLISLRKTGEQLIITSTIDSLLKGAAGNAVHCMNLLFGLHERVGLALKASVY